ncbi:hypothetical protein J2S04_001576 [Alicyclobacillus tengchongensis]|uniref:Uncharacterized protein n=1 Tax=Alicyclobacillus tolerans TaxID=90970 RepID=A0ABT9LWI4_9BACL|nr:hypothetical protein [Alicyclobacillus tengchongensis]
MSNKVKALAIFGALALMTVAAQAGVGWIS